MMNYIFSLHALEQIKNRKLDKNIIADVIKSPESVVKHDECLIICQKVIAEENKKPYLYRVFINVCKDPALIVTAYKTSKLHKYEDKI